MSHPSIEDVWSGVGIDAMHVELVGEFRTYGLSSAPDLPGPPLVPARLHLPSCRTPPCGTLRTRLRLFESAPDG